MKGFSSIVGQIRQALAVSEPGLDTAPGTVTRKIIDAVAEALAETSAEVHSLSFSYDVDLRAGAALDDFVRRFGFTRLPPRRATGSVTFSRDTPATTDIYLPVDTQLKTAGNPTVVVATVVPAILPLGDTEITVPCQAVDSGAIGSVVAGDISAWSTPAISGIVTVSNPVAFVGGADSETDNQLRERFKRTVFRNLAGTEPMFVGVALEDPDVRKVNVVGSSKTKFERIEIASGAATSTVQDAAYIYPGSFFGSDIESGLLASPGVHYTFDHTVNPPTVTVIDTAVIPDGIYDLQFRYLPLASRNDPENGITNRVDVFVDGSRPTMAVETLKFSDSRTFNNTGGSPYLRTNYRRLSGAQPTLGNIFIPLGYAPVVDPSLSDTITIDGDDYTEGVDFWLINDISNEGGTPQSRSGLEWRVVANGAAQVPPNATAFTVTYAFNEVPRSVSIALDRWRMVTTEVLVHQAITILLNFNLIVMPSPGFSASTVEGEVESVVSALVASVGFNGVLQASDVLAAVHAVSGVDAVRFMTSTDDATHYAIQEVAADGTTILATYASSGRAIDVLTGDAEVLALNNVRIVARAQNRFYEGA